MPVESFIHTRQDTWHQIGDHAHYRALMKKMLKPLSVTARLVSGRIQRPRSPF